MKAVAASIVKRLSGGAVAGAALMRWGRRDVATLAKDVGRQRQLAMAAPFYCSSAVQTRISEVWVFASWLRNDPEPSDAAGSAIFQCCNAARRD